MENKQINPLYLAAGVLGALIVLVLLLGIHKNNNPLGQRNYVNAISGASSGIYADKGLEAAGLGVALSNDNVLNKALSNNQLSAAHAALTGFVSEQTNNLSYNPVIADFSKTGDKAYKFRLFLDSSETFYNVTLKFDSQDLPHLTYQVDRHASV